MHYLNNQTQNIQMYIYIPSSLFKEKKVRLYIYVLACSKRFSSKKMVSMIDIVWIYFYALGCQTIEKSTYLVFQNGHFKERLVLKGFMKYFLRFLFYLTILYLLSMSLSTNRSCFGNVFDVSITLYTL